MSKRNKIIGAGICLLTLLIILGLWQKGVFENSDKRLFKLIQNKPELVELFNKAQEIRAEIEKEPEKASLYLNLGLRWKSIAELGGGEPFFQKSLEAYEAGIEKFGQKNILFYLNGGKLAEHLNNFKKAEQYYKKAIEISSADESGYLYLADLYIYKMNKSKEDVLRALESGMNKMLSPVLLIAARAAYFRRVGDYKAALEDYKILSQAFPDNTGYKEVIKELEEKIQ